MMTFPEAGWMTGQARTVQRQCQDTAPILRPDKAGFFHGAVQVLVQRSRGTLTRRGADTAS
jgi:hypothetical protein